MRYRVTWSLPERLNAVLPSHRPDPTNPYWVEVDASDEGTAIMMSRQLAMGWTDEVVATWSWDAISYRRVGRIVNGQLELGEVEGSL